MQLKTEHKKNNNKQTNPEKVCAICCLKTLGYRLLNLSLIHVNQGLELFKYFISLLSMCDYFSTYTNTQASDTTDYVSTSIVCGPLHMLCSFAFPRDDFILSLTKIS